MRCRFRASVWLYVAMTVPPACAQIVSSTFTGNGGDQSWTNTANWQHDMPGLEAFPDNGEGMQFNVTIPLIVNLTQDIEIKDLTFATGGAVSGSAELRVVGTTRCDVPTSAFIGGGGRLNSFGPVQVTSGLIIEDWTVETDVFIIGGGAAANPLVRLQGHGELKVFSTLLFNGDGQVTSANGFEPALTFPNGGTIAKTAAANANSQSVLRTRIQFMGSSTLSSEVGFLTFAEVLGADGIELELDAQTFVNASGQGKVRFECGLKPRTGMEAAIAVDVSGGTFVDFGNAESPEDSLLSVTTSGEGDVRTTGDSDLGAVRMICVPSAPFVLDGTATLQASANFNTFLWKQGVLGTFFNRGTGAQTAAGFGSRIITQQFDNGPAPFNQSHTIRVGSALVGGSPFIRNQDGGRWLMTGSCNLIGDLATARFINAGEIRKSGGGLSTVDLSYLPEFNAGPIGSPASLGLVSADDGEIRIVQSDQVLDRVERRLFRGVWEASGFGIISIGDAGTFGIKSTQGASVSVEGENAMIRGLNKIETIQGVFTVTRGARIDTTGNGTGGDVTVMPEAQECPMFDENEDPEELGDGEAILRHYGKPSEFVCNTLYLQAYATVFNNGILRANHSVQIDFGELRGGGGVIDTPVVHNATGIVAPGNPPYSPSAGPSDDLTGSMSITGDFVQDAAGMLIIEIGGSEPGSYDTLDIGGTATLAGTIAVVPIDGFVPQPGQQFQIVTATNATADFDQVLGPGGFSVDAGVGGLLITYSNSPACTNLSPVDPDFDCDIDGNDYTVWHQCMGGPGIDPDVHCARVDSDADFDIDFRDFSYFQRCFSGSGQSYPLDCVAGPSGAAD